MSFFKTSSSQRSKHKMVVSFVCEPDLVGCVVDCDPDCAAQTRISDDDDQHNFTIILSGLMTQLSLTSDR